DLFADLRVGESRSRGLADHQLAPPLLEPSSALDVEAFAHFNAYLSQAPYAEVRAVGVVHVRQVHHGYQFERSERLSVAPGGDPALELQVLELRAGEVADQLGIRTLAQHQHVERVAGGRERGAQAAYQPQNGHANPCSEARRQS